MSEVRARFIVDIERDRIDGDTEVVDGPLMEEDERRLGVGGSIYDDLPGGGRDGGGMAMPARSRARELVTALFRVAQELVGREVA
jgi:hypothetical protein